MVASSIYLYFLLCSACLISAQNGPSCPVNKSFFPPLVCPDGFSCCKMAGNLVCNDHAPPCTSCAFCCHSYLNASQCSACHAQHCTGSSVIGDAGCNTSTPAEWVPWNPSCCARGMPSIAATALPNCLLIGDSIAGQMFPVVKATLRSECQVQLYEGVDAAYEASCWNSSGCHAAADGSEIAWDVIHYNEGLHSLWPRVDTQSELDTWAGQLHNWTLNLANGPRTPSLIYATMTPFMQQKWCNPPGQPQQDVETKNALAVATVQAVGVRNLTIHDLYSVVTSHCGTKYSTCDWCDNEAQYACPAYPGFCGYHYVQAGVAAIAASTVAAIRNALALRRGW